jgi:hypothetical protein
MSKSQLSLYVNDRGKCVIHYSGFSWLAGFALALWALQRRLYLVAVASQIYSIAYTALVVQLSANTLIILFLVQFAVLGTFANRIHRMLLRRGGWTRTEEEIIYSSGKQK